MKKVFSFSLLACALLLGGCKKDAPTGTLSFTPDWSEVGEEISPLTFYMVATGAREDSSNGIATNHHLGSFAVGSYRVCLYHPAEHISFEGSTVQVETTPDNRVAPLPGWLFTGTTELQVAVGENQVSIPLRQQVRQLTLEVTPIEELAEKLLSIEGTLSGVARGWELNANAPVGSPALVDTQLQRQPDGKWQVKLRLLGVVGTRQQWQVKLYLSHGATSPLLIQSDLSFLLKDFNKHKATPLMLSSKVMTNGLNVSIEDWCTVEDQITLKGMTSH